MKDRLDREIEYLRISVTQGCNLKCIYCNPDKHCEIKNYNGMLTPIEFKVIVESMARLGIRKVRITGGEPLTRPDICDIISCISKIQGIDDISMTTNGMHLENLAGKLKDAGLNRINISIDSLNKDRFKYITGGGSLSNVIKGIKKALEVGLTPVKTNTVLIKGVNDNEIDDFIMLAKDKSIEIRFIELMPVGKFGEQNNDKIIYTSDIIASHPELIPNKEKSRNGPAVCYNIEGYKGVIGFISPMSHKFCNCCNRIRLTCDGKIKPCLGDNSELDITGVLRNTPEKLDELIKRAIFEKPEGHNFNTGFVSNRKMNMIGG